MTVTELDEAIAAAYASEGKQEEANKVYLILLRSTLFVPVKKDKDPQDEEPFRPLFAQVEGKYYMLAFDTEERLQGWAGDQAAQIDFVTLSGRDLIAGMNEQVFLVLNLGTEFYKEFSPDEVKHLKKIVSKIDNLKT